MMTHYPYVITNQYATQVSLWLEAIKRQENLVVLSAPRSDCMMRINQLQEDITMQKKVFGSNTDYFFQILDINPLTIEDNQDLSEYLVDLLNKNQKLEFSETTLDSWANYLNEKEKRVIFVTPQTEKFLSETSMHVLRLFENLFNSYFPVFSFLHLCEVNVVHERNDAFVSEFPKLFQNIFYYALYNKSDTLLFLQYLEKKWNFIISSEVKQNLVHECGGHLWMLKEATRQIKTGNMEYQHQPSMDLRVRTIYQYLHMDEQKALDKVVFNLNDFSPAEIQDKIYLQKINILDQTNNCTISLLSEYVQNRQTSDNLLLEQGKISLNKVPLDIFLSRKEYRILRLLLKERGNLVTRQQLAETIWQEHQEEYSDWAIDRLMARLRKRFQNLSLTPTILESVRGKGYILRK